MDRRTPALGPSDPLTQLVIATLLVSAVFLAFPGLDLWFTGLFYDAAAGFTARRTAPLTTLRSLNDPLVGLVMLAVVASLAVKLARPARPSPIPPAASLYLVASFLLANVVLVNLVLKEHWGRPRPVMVTLFGGDRPYVPVWQITDYCASNCSFVAGEGSSAIWFTGIAFLLPRRWRWPAFAVLLAFAAALSLNRIAFGGHFLSDVLLSWTLTGLVMALVYRFTVMTPPAGLANGHLEARLTRWGTAIRTARARRPNA